MASGDETGFPEFDIAAKAVNENLANMNARADEFLDKANTTIEALRSIQLTNNDTPQPANFMLPAIVIPPVVVPHGPDANLFGSLSQQADVVFEDVGGALGIDSSLQLKVAPYVSTVGTPTIQPPPPAISTDGAPDAPPVNPVAIPTRRVVDDPTPPPLTAIATIPPPPITPPTLGTLVDVQTLPYTAPPTPPLPPLTEIARRTYSSPGNPTEPPLIEPTVPDYTARPDPTDITLIDIAQRTYSGPSDPVLPPLVQINRRTFDGVNTPPTPSLVTIETPIFGGITAPTLNDVEPVFAGRDPGQFTFNEPTYSSSLLAGVQAALARMSAGGTGIPIAIQQALFDAARARESETGLAAEQEAFDTFANRNFSMPPGMLAEAVTIAQERSRFAANGLNRDFLSKAAVWEIENLRFYVTQGVALEAQLREAFNQLAQRSFEAVRAQSEIEIKLLDVQVALYNAKQSARQIGASLYKTRWDGEIARITAFRGEVEAAVAKGQLNTQLVEIFKEQWGGERIKTEVFKTLVDADIAQGAINDQNVKLYLGQWDGVQKAVTVFKTLVESDVAQGQLNEQKIKVWLGQWEAVKIGVDAFKAQVEAAVAKGQINDQRIRVYLGQWEGVKNAVAVFKSEVDTDIAQGQLNEQRLKVYLAQWEAIKNSIEVFKAQISAELAKGQQNEQKVSIYNKQWDGEIAKVGLFKGQVEGNVAQGQLNEQLIKIYLGQWEAVKQAAETFRTEMQGAQIEAGIGKDQVDQFAARVQAHLAVLKSRLVPFEAWTEQNKGEAVRAQIAESEVRGFAETVKAQETEANVKMKVIDLALQGQRVSIEKYKAKLEAARDHVALELDNITAHKEAFVADTQRYSVELQGVNETRRSEIQIDEMRLRNNLAYYETQLHEYDASLNRQIKRVEVIIEALKSTGQITSALGAGAMTAIHMGADIRGSGSMNVDIKHDYPHAQRP